MKAVLILLAMVLSVAMRAEDKPAPTMPDEVTLTSGRVLKKVTVIRWEKERVVLKYAGGVEPVHFSLIKSISPEEIRSMQAEGKRIASLPPAALKTRKIHGQVFVTTMGAGAYKFAGAPVRVYSMSYWDSAKSRQHSLLTNDYNRMNDFQKSLTESNAWIDALAEITPLATTNSDSEGNYELKVEAKEEVFISCFAGRLAAGHREQNTWIVIAKNNEDRVDLNGSNEWVQPE